MTRSNSNGSGAGVLDPERDLLLERTVDVPPELVWRAWTTPDYVRQWWAPAPFTIAECDIDLRPGGIFRTVMRSPEGGETENLGCYLDIVEGTRLVWTTVLGPGFRPNRPVMDLPFTATITIEPATGGTQYSALAMHGTPEAQRRHADLGFHDGWGTVFDQLVDLIRSGAVTGR